MMKNKVIVKIGGGDYTVMSDEPAEHVQTVAHYYDRKLNELAGSGRMPALTGAILAGVNVADEYFKMKAHNDSLIAQLKDYLNDSNRMRNELGEVRRELDRTRAQLMRLQEQRS